jgi:uncharacterized repeat protein (TIGR03803 family)
MHRLAQVVLRWCDRSAKEFAVNLVWQFACASVFFFVAVAPLVAQTLTTLHSFDSTDGASPLAGLTQATDGNLYGTTAAGGAYPYGTIVKITTSGKATTLYSFCAQSGCPDGYMSTAGLVQATDGNFYGTTQYGGADNAGTVFKFSPDGTLTTLHSFCSQSECTDGRTPVAGLIQASNGDLYGTTWEGGTSNGGAVFQITTSGDLTVLYSFDSTGVQPTAGVIEAANGNFYGTTLRGGSVDTYNCYHVRMYGCGTIYEITPTGALVMVYDFKGYGGGNPYGGLVQASDGNFYGTTDTDYGDTPSGTVFRLPLEGNLRTLYGFCADEGCTDGSIPTANLIQATDGNFYGTTEYGGTTNQGTIFEITPEGTLTMLYSFCPEKNCKDGSNPWGALVQDTDGNFYGTTESGGAGNLGTVFKLSTGLGPFVATQTSSGKVGSVVKILGTNLTGASAVSFNGTAASFDVESESEIKTTVPSGATTGFVTVIAPNGQLKSSAEFRVTE